MAFQFEHPGHVIQGIDHVLHKALCRVLTQAVTLADFIHMRFQHMEGLHHADQMIQRTERFRYLARVKVAVRSNASLELPKAFAQEAQLRSDILEVRFMPIPQVFKELGYTADTSEFAGKLLHVIKQTVYGFDCIGPSFLIEQAICISTGVESRNSLQAFAQGYQLTSQLFEVKVIALNKEIVQVIRQSTNRVHLRF